MQTGETQRLGLALSGGGFRAAAFHLGILRGLRRVGRLAEVEVVSAVSGGALLAAAWVARGRQDFDGFEARMRAFLARDLKRRVLVAALRPDRLLRLLADPGYSLTEVMAAVLDREVFHGATLGALDGARPRLVLNATCVNHGTGWRFTPDRIGDWMLKTEDRETLAAFPLARAVVASAAFPGGFAPVCLRGRDVFPASARPHGKCSSPTAASTTTSASRRCSQRSARPSSSPTAPTRSLLTIIPSIASASPSRSGW